MARRHIAEGTALVEKQQSLIDRLVLDKRDPTEARKTLATMLELLEQMRHELAREEGKSNGSEDA